MPGGTIEPVRHDRDGFVPTGDAGRLVDEDDPSAGVAFVGRLGENFKLSSGTWVSVARVRLALLEACAPLVLEAVIAGHDRDHIGALLFLTPGAKQLPPEQLAERLHAALVAYNASHAHGSERIARAMVVAEPLSLDEGETTDKAYTNQRRVLERRAAAVAALFSDRGGAEVWSCDQADPSREP
jgi:feruloyl-CoA synthase